MEDARDLVGQTVLVRLDSTEGLEFAGIESDCPFFCKVAAVDEVGMWVENKKFLTIELKDSGGKCIPKEKQVEETNTVNFLLPWRKVITVVKFPDKDPEELAGEALGSFINDDKRIGFIK